MNTTLADTENKMLIQALLGAVIDFINALVGWLPLVDKLPTVLGFNLDGALVMAVGMMRTLFTTFWVLGIVFEGFIALMGYYSIKMIAKLLLGSRTPINT